LYQVEQMASQQLFSRTNVAKILGVSQVYLGRLFFKLAVRPHRSRAVDLFTPAQLKTITKLCPCFPADFEEKEDGHRFR
jgi:hypothetical protein